MMDLLKAANQVLKDASRLFKKSDGIINSTFDMLTEEQKKDVKPLIELRSELNKAIADKDTARINEVIEKLSLYGPSTGNTKS